MRFGTVRNRALAIDVGVAVLVFGLTVIMLGARGLGTPDPGTPGDDALSTLLAAASAFPLVVRRLAPLAVYATTGVASLALLAIGYGFDVPFGPLVAVYALAVAYGGEPRPGLRVLAMAAAAAFVPAAIGAIAASGADVRRVIAPGFVVWALFFAGAWIAGDRTRLRGERIAVLEERARRADREAERERRLAAAEERTRIARELHDSAGHAINVILVQAGAARLLQDRDPAGSRQAIATIEEVARGTITEIDKLVRALREEQTGELAPAEPAALDELVERHRTGGLRVDADLPDARPALPYSVAWATYRILQEALTNAARHGVGSAGVAVEHGPEAVEITVTNPTAPTGSAAGSGHGIAGMRERAVLLGGTLDIDAEDGTFHLHARLPRGEAVL